jgi:hypothetical protein
MIKRAIRKLIFHSLYVLEQIAIDGKTRLPFPADDLINLQQMGLKIIPCPFNTKDLFTEEEFAKIPNASKSVVKLVYLDVEQIVYTPDKISENAWRFEDARVIPGKIYLMNTDGSKSAYMLCILDIDSEVAYERCRKYFEDWTNNTWVTKSHREFGYHIYWLERWTEDNDFVSIHTDDCESKDVAFEVFVSTEYTQILGPIHPSSSKIQDPNFEYKNIGCRNLAKPALMIRDGLYDSLLKDFKDLLKNPDKIQTLREMQKKSKNVFHNPKLDSESTTQDFEDWQIALISKWASRLQRLRLSGLLRVAAFMTE